MEKSVVFFFLNSIFEKVHRLLDLHSLRLNLLAIADVHWGGKYTKNNPGIESTFFIIKKRELYGNFIFIVLILTTIIIVI